MSTITGSAGMAGDEIHLRLPGDPSYGRLARIAATSLARRLGFTFRQIEDLGLAVDEAVILLHQPATGTVEGIDVRLRVAGDGIELEAAALPRPTDEAAGDALDPEAVERFEAIVDDAAVTWQVRGSARHVTLVAHPR